MRSSASLPLRAVSTWWPSISSKLPSRRWILSSSSTTRIERAATAVSCSTSGSAVRAAPATTGSSMMKVLPCPGWLSAQMRPLCSSMMP